MSDLPVKTSHPTDPWHARAPICLLVLRLTLGIFLLQWAVEKFVNPERFQRIWDYFYFYDLKIDFVPIMGGVQIVIILALLAGFYRRLSYGAAFAMHSISVVATWRELIDPYDLTTHNHLFMTGVPVLAAFWLLYMLRDFDLYSADVRLGIGARSS